jgi:hypothetical protein
MTTPGSIAWRLVVRQNWLGAVSDGWFKRCSIFEFCYRSVSSCFPAGRCLPMNRSPIQGVLPSVWKTRVSEFNWNRPEGLRRQTWERVLYRVHWTFKSILHITSLVVTSAYCFVHDHGAKNIRLRSHFLEMTCSNGIESSCGIQGHCCDSVIRGHFCVATMTLVSTVAAVQTVASGHAGCVVSRINVMGSQTGMDSV